MSFHEVLLDPLVLIPGVFIVLLFYFIARRRRGRSVLWNLRLQRGKHASLSPVKQDENGLVHQEKSSYMVLPGHVVMLDEGPVRGRLIITREDLTMPLVYEDVFQDVHPTLPNGGEPTEADGGDLVRMEGLDGWRSFLYPDLKTAQHTYKAVHEQKLGTLYGVFGGWEKWITWGLLALVVVLVFLL